MHQPQRPPRILAVHIYLQYISMSLDLLVGQSIMFSLGGSLTTYSFTRPN